MKTDGALDILFNNAGVGDLGRIEKVAGTVAFLASDDASFMTGAEVYVDGGYMAS